MENVRSEFSIYTDQPNLVYLDSAATSLTPDCVVDAMSDYYKYYRATVHRTSYDNGVRADQKYSESRAKIANYMNAEEEEIIFTKGTTAGINSIARALIAKLEEGDEIITSEFSHHSNLLPWRETSDKVVVKYANIYNDQITLEGIKEVLSEKTKIIAIHHVSNVIGDITPIKEIADFCNANDIIFVVDGAQGICHEKIDVKEIGMDFYLFSGHKFYGPTGIGIVYGKKEKLQKLVFDFGGDMAHTVTKEVLKIKELPVGLEAGTPSIAEVIGLGEAVSFAEKLDIDKVHTHTLNLKQYALELLKDVDGIKIYNADAKTGLIVFTLENAPVHDALSSYSKLGVCLRGGHMCNQLTLNYLGVPAVLRASINAYNNKNDIEVFVEATKKVIQNPMLWWE